MTSTHFVLRSVGSARPAGDSDGPWPILDTGNGGFRVWEVSVTASSRLRGGPNNGLGTLLVAVKQVVKDARHKQRSCVYGCVLVRCKTRVRYSRCVPGLGLG